MKKIIFTVAILVSCLSFKIATAQESAHAKAYRKDKRADESRQTAHYKAVDARKNRNYRKDKRADESRQTAHYKAVDARKNHNYRKDKRADETH